jgi:hypothetical protein
MFKSFKKVDQLNKASLREGNFVLTGDEENVIVGRIEYVMIEGIFGVPGSEYSIEASEDEPALLIRKFEQEEESGLWEETQWLIGKPMKMCTLIQPLLLEQEDTMAKSIDLNSNINKSYWNGSFSPKGSTK